MKYDITSDRRQRPIPNDNGQIMLLLLSLRHFRNNKKVLLVVLLSILIYVTLQRIFIPSSRPSSRLQLKYEIDEHHITEILDLMKHYHNSLVSRSKSSSILTIIVLGEKLQNDGNATTNLHCRLRTAYQLVQQLQQHLHKQSQPLQQQQQQQIHMIFSGGDTAQINQTEASVMKKLWDDIHSSSSSVTDRNKNNQMPLITIALEDQSLSTCQNAFYSIPILMKTGGYTSHTGSSISKPIIPLVVVTSDYHVPRATLLFEQVFRTEAIRLYEAIKIIGIPAATSNATERQRLFSNERHWLQNSTLKLLLTQLSNHPFELPTVQRIEKARSELDQSE